MFRSTLCVVALLGAMLITSYAHADYVILTNGDKISGKIVGKRYGKLEVETGYAGKIKIKWNEVAKVSTESPMQVRLNTGETYYGALNSTNKDQVSIATAEDSETVTLDRIAFMGTAQKTAKKTSVYRGNIAATGQIEAGNSPLKEFEISVLAVMTRESNRYTLDWMFDWQEKQSDTTKFKTRLRLQMDHFISAKQYMYARSMFEQDRFKDIKLRTTLGGGYGYQLFETEKLMFSLEGGVNYVLEKFYDSDENNRYPAFAFRADYEQRFFNEYLTLFMNESLNFSPASNGNSFNYFRTGVRLPLFDHFNLTLQYENDWESNPAPGTVAIDQTGSLGFGYTW